MRPVETRLPRFVLEPSSTKVVKQRRRRARVGGFSSFDNPVIDRTEQCRGLGTTGLILPDLRQGRRRSQFPGQRALFPGELAGFEKDRFGFSGIGFPK